MKPAVKVVGTYDDSNSELFKTIKLIKQYSTLYANCIPSLNVLVFKIGMLHLVPPPPPPPPPLPLDNIASVWGYTPDYPNVDNNQKIVPRCTSLPLSQNFDSRIVGDTIRG